MAEYTIRKPDYDEIILPAVTTHRPRPHEDLAVIAGLLDKLEVLGGLDPDTGRGDMTREEASVDLTDAEASLLHGIVRQRMRRTVDARRAVALRYLVDPLEAVERESSITSHAAQLDERISERKAELRRLAIEERETKQRVENLRSREARASDGAEA